MELSMADPRTVGELMTENYGWSLYKKEEIGNMTYPLYIARSDAGVMAASGSGFWFEFSFPVGADIVA